MVPVLQIKNLSVDFITAGIITHAVKDFSLNINRGELVALVGESGSGKSVTSLSVLRLLAQPPAQYSGGNIYFSEDGIMQTDLLRSDNSVLEKIRGNKIAMIFQEPMTSLNPVMTCGKQVMEAIQIHKKTSNKNAKEQTINWFAKVNLADPENIFNKYPHELSGGQKQRVMIAMAMSNSPCLLICDEPTTALDVTVQKTILHQIKQLQQEQNMGVLFITHDLGIVAEIADRVAIMYKGEIVEENNTREIFTNPRHPYTKALIACRPSKHAKGTRLPVVADFLGDQKVQVTDNHDSIVTVASIDLMNVANLSVQYKGRTNFLGKSLQVIKAVNDVSFSIVQGETLGLVGESGSGKTTLGRTLLRLIEPSSGKIYYKGASILDPLNNSLKQLRKEVQLVFQDPYSSLNPTLKIGNAIEEPMRVVGNEKGKNKRRQRVADLLERVNLLPEFMNRYPHEFSGGQRQRIVIARALALNPGLLVCDESVSALDVSVQAQVLNLLNDLKKQLGLTMFFISHDLSVVRYMCDRIMVMHKGEIVETGTTEDIFNYPRHAYTKTLLQSIPEA